MPIKLSRNLSLPEDAVTWKMGLIGRTGKGKTNTAIVMAEQMIAAGSPVVILDPQGDWWGLRSKYQIAILGGDHGDIPLDPRAGETVADFVVAHRHPVLIDLFGMGEAEMVRFATDFAKRLWRENREALHIFLDEADLFAPQSGAKGPKAQCLGAWQNVVRRGRSRGLGCTMITQRAAVLNKDLLTQADPLFVHGLSASRDLAAVDEYLDYYGIDRKARRGITGQIAKLQVGECFVLSPGTLEIDPLKVAVKKRNSFDSSATPQAGKTRQGPRSLAKVDLSSLQKQMASTIEEAKANDPKLLKEEIRKLKKQVGKQKPTVDQDATERAVAQAVKERDRHWEGETKKLLSVRSKLVRRLHQINDLSATNGESTVEVNGPPPVLPKSIPASTKRTPTPRTSERAQTGSLPKGELAILKAVAMYDEGVQREQLSVLAGYKRSSRDTYVQRLREKGLVETEGTTLLASPLGIETLGDGFEPLPTGTELYYYWARRLPTGEKAVLAFVWSEHPRIVSREEISDATDYKRSSRDTYLKRLKSRLLVITSASGVRASDLLFD